MPTPRLVALVERTNNRITIVLTYQAALSAALRARSVGTPASSRSSAPGEWLLHVLTLSDCGWLRR